MGKKDVLFEAVVDFAVSFVVVILAVRIIHPPDGWTFVFWFAGTFAAFCVIMDVIRGKETRRVLACVLTTFVGAVAGGAAGIFLS